MSDDQYKFIKELGSGSFGSTWLAQDKKTREKVAIKIFKAGKDEESAVYYWQWEIQMLKDLLDKCYPFAVCLVNSYIEDHAPRLVMQYVDGESMEHLLLSRKTLPTCKSKFKNVAFDLIKGIQMIHSQGIVHEDIKELNIMWDKQMGTFRYIDFGLACARCGEDKKCKDTVNLKKVQFPCATYGTRWIAAPDVEALRKENPIVPWSILEAKDYWDIGLVLLRWFTFLANIQGYYLIEYDKFLGKQLSEYFIKNTRLNSENPLYYLLSPDFIQSEVDKIKIPQIQEIVGLLLEFDGYKRFDNFKQIVKNIKQFK